jgi:hypothetical protein
VGVVCQRHVPAALPPGKKPNIHFTGDYVGARDWTGAEKSCTPPGFDPRTIQTPVSRYTDYGFVRLTCEKHHKTAIQNSVWPGVRLVIVLVCEPQARNGWITNELGKDVEENSTDLVQRTIIELQGTTRQPRNVRAVKQSILFQSGETNA